MDYIAHRINTIKQLKLLDNKYGIEIDIRDDGKDLIIVHDPFKKGIKSTLGDSFLNTILFISSSSIIFTNNSLERLNFST